ncbi:MAG: glycine C-acetyltransferase, partial [Chitinophagaceae bacterium]
MNPKFTQRIGRETEEVKAAGLYKKERIITTPQSAHIAVTTGQSVLNMCANNYLGLADNPEIIKAAKDSFD